MSTCKSCKKELGFFSIKRRCCKCYEIICNKCTETVDYEQFGNEILLLNKIGELDQSLASKWNGNAFFCKTCWYKIKPKFIKLSNSGGVNVKTYTINYQGKIPKYTRHMCYVSEYYKDRNEAFTEIKRIAEFLGSSCVIDINLKKDTGQDGNYIYSIWAVEGKIIF
ncbi:MAG: hypothetical protein IIW53_06750 [Rikenellaceae bacterium]|nr:hypothetical protein [Rikenellaceae bacterium]MBQ5853773.1 hypothetical protein [Rikenellaceae bacterium]